MTYSNGIRASATWHIRDYHYVIKKIWSSMLGSSNVGHKKSTMCVKRCKMGPLPFMAGMGCNQMHASKSLIRQCMPIVSVLRYLPLFPVRPPRACLTFSSPHHWQQSEPPEFQYLYIPDPSSMLMGLTANDKSPTSRFNANLQQFPSHMVSIHQISLIRQNYLTLEIHFATKDAHRILLYINQVSIVKLHPSPKFYMDQFEALINQSGSNQRD